MPPVMQGLKLPLPKFNPQTPKQAFGLKQQVTGQAPGHRLVMSERSFQRMGGQLGPGGASAYTTTQNPFQAAKMMNTQYGRKQTIPISQVHTAPQGILPFQPKRFTGDLGEQMIQSELKGKLPAPPGGTYGTQLGQHGIRGAGSTLPGQAQEVPISHMIRTGGARGVYTAIEAGILAGLSLLKR